MKKVILLGYFDSLHIGHRYLFNVGKELAQRYDVPMYIATFDDSFLKHFGRLNDEIYLLNEKLEILSEIGIDDVIVFPGTKEFLSKKRTEFLEYIEQLDPCAIVCGRDYRFGKNAAGDVSFLLSYFSKKNIDVYPCDLINFFGKKVSSTDIRTLLKDGKIYEANALLGRKFFYEGIVEHGKSRGRDMGFPTVNLQIEGEKIRIKSGVYATCVIFDGEKHLSVTNVGKHPTFDDDTFNIETHIIGENIEIYGKKVRVEFYKFIRDVIKFCSKEELISQIKKDVLVVKATKDGVIL